MSTPTDHTAALKVLHAAQQHHVSMSAMADVKASFLLATSIITLALTGPQAVHDPKQGGLIALAVTSLLVGSLASRALMPRLLMLREPDRKPELNLLFCGHFAQLGEDDYVNRIKKALSDGDGAVDALARDVFQMGMILHQKKFRHLGYAYTVCFGGLIASAIAAIVPKFFMQ